MKKNKISLNLGKKQTAKVEEKAPEAEKSKFDSLDDENQGFGGWLNSILDIPSKCYESFYVVKNPNLKSIRLKCTQKSEIVADRSDDGMETMKLFVIANSIVMLTTLVYPHLKTAIEILGEMIYGVEESEF